MLSFGDQQYLISNRVVLLGDAILAHLCSELPDNPYAAAAAFLAPFATAEAVAQMVPPPPQPERPLPPHQRDYLQQKRIGVMLEEWTHFLVSYRPINPLQASYRYFLRNTCRIAAEAPVPYSQRFARSRSPNSNNRPPSPSASPYGEQKAVHSSSSEPPVEYTLSGYSADVTPRISRGPTPTSTAGPLKPPPRSPLTPESSHPSHPQTAAAAAHSSSESPPRHASPSDTVSRPSEDSLNVSPVSTPSPTRTNSVDPPLPARVKILVLVYSVRDSCINLANAALSSMHGMDRVLVEPYFYRFPDLEDSVVEEEGGIRYEADDPRFIPELPGVDLLPQFDGFLFVFPVRFGGQPAAVQSLLDRTGGLWAQGALVGKPAGVIVSTVAQHGGHETAVRSFHRSLLHHGMVLVGLSSKDLEGGADSPNGTVQGSGFYGAGTIQGAHNERQASHYEEVTAGRLAIRVAEVAAKLLRP